MRGEAAWLLCCGDGQFRGRGEAPASMAVPPTIPPSLVAGRELWPLLSAVPGCVAAEYRKWPLDPPPATFSTLCSGQKTQ
mmetsp:Transcript_49551/g.160112  ORF Transcript_49551/g.160112 Transcript_49551/m.160112 type:complete len:80 (+) Transcript_49551:553-792(+)